MVTVATDEASMQADELLALATSEPRRARPLAEEVRDRACRETNPAAISIAEQALGLAARELGEIDVAVSHLRAAVAIAERAGLSKRAAEARVSLAPTLLYAGRSDEALREADRAAAVLRGPDLARLQMQRAGILHRLGRLDEALALLRPAAAAFRRSGDIVWEARLLNNRGILHCTRGAFQAADRDFRDAAGLFARSGDEVSAALMLMNRGWLCGRRGDVPGALVLYDQSEERLRALGIPLAVLLVAKCEVLLSVGLAAEARSTAEMAVGELERGGMRSDVPEAQLKLAYATLLAGDPEVATAVASRAASAFSRQNRPGWEAIARWVAVRARWESGNRTATTQRAALASAEALAAAGQVVVALDARLVAAQIALHRRKVGEAECLLGGARVRRRAPAELRTRAWYAQALLRTARGDSAGADRALRAGWRVLDDYRASLGATELRASVAGHGQDLARLGVAQGLAAGRPEAVLRWAERGRAAALRLRPVRPPEDAALANDLAELRQVAGELAVAGSPAAANTLMSRQVTLEEAVRRRARQAAGTGAVEAVPTISQLAAALGSRVLVEIVHLDGFLHALVLRDGGAVLRPLGPVEPADRELDQLRFSLRRLALRRGSTASMAAAVAGAAAAVGRLEALLLEPLSKDIGDRPLVLAPPGRLHTLPWSVLPSCHGRPLSVVPSSALWLKALRVRSHAGHTKPRVLLVAGPDLPHAWPEIDQLRREYPEATVLRAHEATADQVGRRMASVDIAHVAAHGIFRSDNPLFSCLRLADGPFTVYDLEAMRGSPSLLVLSACDSGLSAVRPGDELMGLASALFQLGTGMLVATVGPVPDDATAALMVDFHRRLRGGADPADALAGAGGSRWASADPEWVAVASFVAFGAG